LSWACRFNPVRLSQGDHHASGVCLNNQGVLILGKSGSGKSSLALNLLALGAELIADDRLSVHLQNGCVMLSRPPNALPFVEARGVGLLHATMSPAMVALKLVVDLDKVEHERLPPQRYVTCETCSVPLLHNTQNSSFPAAIRQYLLYGRHDPET